VMNTSSPSLLALSRAEQEGAKRWFVLSRSAHVATLIVTLPTLFVEGKPAYFLALAALVSEAMAWLFRWLGDRKHSLAEEGRRRALLADALAKPADALAIRDLRARFSRHAKAVASNFEDPDYYATKAAPGPARLRAELQESAFWSRELYGASATIAYGVAAVLLVLVIGALFIVAGTESSDGSLVVARVGVLFLSFLVFSDILTQGLAWTDASKKSDEVYRRLEHVSLEDEGAALAVFGDYCVATATTPPIPSVLYRLHKDRIETAWRSADFPE
jgi:hypothetical protein